MQHLRATASEEELRAMDTVVDFDQPEATCPACGTVFATTATRCPDCGLRFA